MPALTQNAEGPYRLQSIDIVRGIIMIIMALDHVREFFSYTTYRATDVTQASVFLFFTRWITHLCAPTFVFLSGVSIFLYARKIGSHQKTSVFLLTRGLWLIVVEVFVISFILTQGYQLTLLEVIWAIACSMILLAGLIWLPRGVQLVLALVMIVGHNALPPVGDVTSANMLIAFLHNSPFFIAGPPMILVAYTIVPWVGVMLLGYWMGKWFTYEFGVRDKLLLRAGVSALVVFVVLRFFNVYGDPSPWSVQERGGEYTFLSFLNVTKSPPSLLFLSVTLGITCMLLVLVAPRERVSRVVVGISHQRQGARATQFLATYGRVPFFYFVVHLAVISFSSYVWTYFQFGRCVNLAFDAARDWPAEYSPSLLRTYFVWVLLVAVLYFPCRWWGDFKATGKWWSSYL